MEFLLGRWWTTAAHARPVEGHLEGVLAKARLLVAGAAILAALFERAAVDHPMALPVLAAYALYALGGFVASRAPQLPSPTLVAVHAADLAWAGAVAVAAPGHDSPTLLLLAFALVAGSFRWAARGAAVTAAAAVVVIAAAAAIVALSGGEVRIERIVVRVILVATFSWVLGHAAETEDRLQRETSAVARIVSSVRADLGVKATIEAMVAEIRDVFGASAVLLALRETYTGEIVLWESRGPGRDAGRVSSLDEAGRQRYLFPHPAEVCWATRNGGDALRVFALEGEAFRAADAGTMADPFAGEPFRSLLCVQVSIGEEASGRLLVFDPRAVSGRDADLRLVRALARRVAPALQNVYLLRRLHSRAGAVERARVARELHDGVIQSLIGLEMQVDVLRRQAQEKSAQHAGALTHIQALLRQEILTVRELMEQMKPVEVGPSEVLDHLAQMLDKFQRQTAIEARFLCEEPEVSLAPRTCSELIRIVQEALINVRRHSGAGHVVVSLRKDAGAWVLSVDDDGKGFGFAGRLTQKDLDQGRKGPVVIKERVRAAGGELAIESRPHQGSRLEVTLPRGARA